MAHSLLIFEPIAVVMLSSCWAPRLAHKRSHPGYLLYLAIYKHLLQPMITEYNNSPGINGKEELLHPEKNYGVRSFFVSSMKRIISGSPSIEKDNETNVELSEVYCHFCETFKHFLSGCGHLSLLIWAIYLDYLADYNSTLDLITRNIVTVI